MRLAFGIYEMADN